MRSIAFAETHNWTDRVPCVTETNNKVCISRIFLAEFHAICSPYNVVLHGFRREVWSFQKKVSIFKGRDAHRCHNARTKRILFLKNATPPMQNLEYFRGAAELNLKSYLRMEPESVIGVSNILDLAWFGLTSKHSRQEVCIFSKSVAISCGRDAHRCLHAGCVHECVMCDLWCLMCDVP